MGGCLHLSTAWHLLSARLVLGFVDGCWGAGGHVGLQQKVRQQWSVHRLLRLQFLRTVGLGLLPLKNQHASGAPSCAAFNAHLWAVQHACQIIANNATNFGQKLHHRQLVKCNVVAERRSNLWVQILQRLQLKGRADASSAGEQGCRACPGHAFPAISVGRVARDALPGLQCCHRSAPAAWPAPLGPRPAPQRSHAPAALR